MIACTSCGDNARECGHGQAPPLTLAQRIAGPALAFACLAILASAIDACSPSPAPRSCVCGVTP